MNKTLLVGVTVIGVLAAAGCGASHANAARPLTHLHNAAGPSSAVKGSIPKIPGCGPHDIASVAVIRSGASLTSLSRINPRPLARIADTSNGKELAFFNATGFPAAGNGASSVFSVGPELIPADPALQSCQRVLQDRPGAQPYIAAAVNAAIARGVAPSASSLRASLNTVEIGDNPLQHGSLVIELLLNGTPSAGPNGHTVYGTGPSVFVVLDRASRNITGTAVGTW
jgi:hypothetical protein